MASIHTSTPSPFRIMMVTGRNPLSVTPLLLSLTIVLLLWISSTESIRTGVFSRRNASAINSTYSTTEPGILRLTTATTRDPEMTTTTTYSATTSESSSSTSSTSYENDESTTSTPSTRTTTLPPVNDSDYDDEFSIGRSDEYIYDLMESLMMTIHEKLRRAETLENTCKRMLDQMSRRLDTMEDKFDYHNNRIDVAVSKLRSIDTKLLQIGGTGTLDIRLQSLNSKVDSLGTKLAELKDDFVRDKRGTALPMETDSVTTPHDGDLAAQGSERRDIIKDKSGRSVHLVLPEADEKVTRDIESVKDTLTNLDNKVQYWMQHVSSTANNIAQTIGDLHDAIMEPSPQRASRVDDDIDDSSTTDSDSTIDTTTDYYTSESSTESTVPLTTTEQPMRYSNNHRSDITFGKETKLDKLFRKIHPIIRATEKMDEMWNVVLGTQRLVDDSLQKSDQLLTNSYRQVQSLSDVKMYLQHQTGKIMQNLEQVEDWLKEQGTAATNFDPKIFTQDIKYILNKTSQLHEFQTPEYQQQQQVMERSSDYSTEHPETETYYHHDGNNESSHDRRRIQSLEPKSGSNGNYSTRHNALPFVKKPLVMHQESFKGFNATNDNDNLCPLQGPPGTNCADLRRRGVTKSGIYYILIKGTTYWFMKVYCDMETADGGWTVIQRRDDFGHPRENFIRDWNDYKNGFGDMKREFWLGNENVFMLTNQEDYALRVDLEDFENHKRYAIYTKFKIYSEAENYKLEIGGYEGNAGDSLNDPWYGSNISPFSTYDRDNDRSSLNCASMLRGGWWWRSCGRGLNGIYLTNPTDLAARQGIVWFRWRGWDYTLKRARMSIRPKSYIPVTKG